MRQLFAVLLSGGIKKKMSSGKTTSIRITSRASVKVRDNFYTVEYCEERSIPEDADVKEERAELWDVCNTEVDEQIKDIIKTFK